MSSFVLFLFSGTVELTDLFPNLDLLNNALKTSPFQLESASIGSVKLEVPWYDPWNGKIKVTMDSLTCEVTIL
jgi:hypothetical protein